jgi:type I restriction enzyme R subunit
MNQGFADDKVTSDELQTIMDDYNRMFGTAFTTENFSAYYDDINLRMKKKKPDMEPLDLLLVVGMFLTGFDAKKLNTLYVDKNLEYHGLLQAFSRTNRVLNEKKRFGKVVCFRDLKDNVDAAIKLFSNNQPNEFIIREPFEEVKKELNNLTIEFLKKYPKPQYIDTLQSELDKRDFVLAFREIIKKQAEIQIYEDYNTNDPDLYMTEQEFADFKSKYLDITVGVINPPVDATTMAAEGEIPYNDESGLENIDFCLELLHSDVINVAYILELIANLNPDEEDYDKKRQDILDTMIKDAVMRNKSKLIDDFIRENVDNDKAGFQQAKADGSMDLESRLNEYIATSRNNAVHSLAVFEGIEEEALTKFISEYDYLHREKPEIIQKAIRAKKGLKLMERSMMLKRIIERLREIINTYNWD